MCAAPSARASVAIRLNGELLPVRGELSSDAVFPIYSITKTLVAICALKLAERGRLPLDAPIGALVPNVDLPEAITLTHLLRHTSGLEDYGGVREYHDSVRSHPSQPWTRQQFLDWAIPKGLLFAPGQRFSYSNIGHMLVTDAIERATGCTLAQNLESIIVRPLGLKNTFTLEQLDDMKRCMPGFSSEVTIDRSVRDVRDVYHPGWCAPRLVASTTEETSRIFDALITGELLESKTRDLMFTLVPLPEDTGAPPSIGGGMGIFSDSASPRGRNYSNAGGGPGYSTVATIYPGTPQGRVAIAVFLDSSEGPDARSVENQWLEKL